MYTNRGLSEQEKNLIGNLQDKIKAKLDVAKTLGAFFTGRSPKSRDANA
ncbi:hypothetical protein [Mesorhizobium sp. M0571]